MYLVFVNTETAKSILLIYKYVSSFVIAAPFLSISGSRRMTTDLTDLKLEVAVQRRLPW